MKKKLGMALAVCLVAGAVHSMAFAENTAPAESTGIESGAEAGDGTPAGGGETPAGGEETPAEGEETPAEGEEAPAGGEEAPAEGEEAPAEGEEAPAEGEEAPAGGTETPAGGEEKPAGGAEAPVEGEAPAQVEVPAVVGEPAMLTIEHVLTVGETEYVESRTISGLSVGDTINLKDYAWDDDDSIKWVDVPAVYEVADGENVLRLHYGLVVLEDSTEPSLKITSAPENL